MLNILVACKTPTTMEGLRFACADDQRVIYDTSPGWGKAANNLLGTAQALGGDALFIDDDVALTAGCLDHVFSHYTHADLFGLDLHDMNRQRQQGARHVLTEDGELVDWVQPGPAYVAHVSTSAFYIKQSALSLRFPIWPGLHWEDVAFCMDAWLQGFRVLAVPGYVTHNIESGVGATKRHDPAFWQKWMANKQSFEHWARTKHVFEQGIVPIGAREL